MVQDCHEDSRGAEPQWGLELTTNERPRLPSIMEGVNIQKDALIQSWV